MDKGGIVFIAYLLIFGGLGGLLLWVLYLLWASKNGDNTN